MYCFLVFIFEFSVVPNLDCRIGKSLYFQVTACLKRLLFIWNVLNRINISYFVLVYKQYSADDKQLNNIHFNQLWQFNTMRWLTAWSKTSNQIPAYSEISQWPKCKVGPTKFFLPTVADFWYLLKIHKYNDQSEISF